MGRTAETLKRCVRAATTREVCRVSALVTLLLLPPSVLAQLPAPTGAELPTMVLKVCPKLEDAKNQADMSFQFAKVQGPVVIEPRFLWQGCFTLPVILRLRSQEEAIRPFETWVVSYDANSSTTFDAKHAGVTYKVPYTIRKQRVRYFVAEFMVPLDADDARIGQDDRGKWFPGWVEMPDDPYLSKYLQLENP